MELVLPTAPILLPLNCARALSSIPIPQVCMVVHELMAHSRFTSKDNERLCKLEFAFSS
jgi:hypothetical protein